MIWQDDQPVDFFRCGSRHCSGSAIGFEAVDKNAAVSVNARNGGLSYRDTEGHEGGKKWCGRRSLLCCFGGCDAQSGL